MKHYSKKYEFPSNFFFGQPCETRSLPRNAQRFKGTASHFDESDYVDWFSRFQSIGISSSKLFSTIDKFMVLEQLEGLPLVYGDNTAFRADAPDTIKSSPTGLGSYATQLGAKSTR